MKLSPLSKSPCYDESLDVETDTLGGLLEQSPEELNQVSKVSGTYTNANLSDNAGPEPGVVSENLIYSEVKSCLYTQNTGRNTIDHKTINFSPPGEGGNNKRDKNRMANYSDGQTWLDTLPFRL